MILILKIFELYDYLTILFSWKGIVKQIKIIEFSTNKNAALSLEL